MTIDPGPENAAGSMATAAAPLVQRIRLAIVGLFILGLFVQFYLAGRGAFGASSYSTHKDFGDVLHLVTPVILLLTILDLRTRDCVDVTLSILLIILYVHLY